MGGRIHGSVCDEREGSEDVCEGYASHAKIERGRSQSEHRIGSRAGGRHRTGQGSSGRLRLVLRGEAFES